MPEEFISIPSEVSSVTTGLCRPLAIQVIRFLNNLQGFVDLQKKYPLAQTTWQEDDSLKSVASNEADAQAAAFEAM
jgi:hypothetical protein